MEHIHHLNCDIDYKSSDVAPFVNEVCQLDEIMHIETLKNNDGDHDNASADHVRPVNATKRRLRCELKSLLNDNHKDVQYNSDGVLDLQATVDAPRSKRNIKPRKLYDDRGLWISSALSCSDCGAHLDKTRQCWNCNSFEGSKSLSLLETVKLEECTSKPTATNGCVDTTSANTKTSCKVTAGKAEVKPKSLSRAEAKRMLQGLDPIECEACFKCFTRRKIVEHRKMVHGLSKHEFQCPYCPKRLKTMENREQHLERHHPNLQKCMTRNQKNKIKIFMYDCPECEISKSIVDLRYHMNKEHNVVMYVENLISCTCPFCLMGKKPVRRIFRTMEGFLSHLSADHPGCTLVGKKYQLADDSTTLFVPEPKKKKIKMVKQEDCEADSASHPVNQIANRPKCSSTVPETRSISTSRGDDIKEMLESSAPAECEACFKIVSKSSLSSHKIRMHNLSPTCFQCKYCSKRFDSENGRLQHIEKEHQYCPATVSQLEKDKFRMYLYNCPKCATVRSYADLRDHMKNQHEMAIQDAEDSLTCICPFCLLGSTPVKRSFQNMDIFSSHLNNDHPGCIMLGKKVGEGSNASSKSLSPSGDVSITPHGRTKPGFSPRGVHDMVVNIKSDEDILHDSKLQKNIILSEMIKSSMSDTSLHGKEQKVIYMANADSFYDFFEKYIFPRPKTQQETSGPLKPDRSMIEEGVYDSLCDGYCFEDVNGRRLNLFNQIDKDDLVDYILKVIYQNHRSHPNSHEKIPKPVKEATAEDLRDIIDSIFKCSICLEIMNDIHTFPQCFHSICHSCSIEFFRKCRSRCPECSTHISSIRNLRRDERFNELRNLIYGDDGAMNTFEIYDHHLMESIKKCFKCSRCSNPINESYAIPECLHRLCEGCAAISHHTICPKCKCQNGSVLPIRRDHKFDQLKDLLFSSDGFFEKSKMTLSL